MQLTELETRDILVGSTPAYHSILADPSDSLSVMLVATSADTGSNRWTPDRTY